VAAGVPVLLVWAGGWPFPTALPSPAEISEALERGWRPDGRFVVGSLSLTVWVLWAYLMGWVVAEARRARRPGGAFVPDQAGGRRRGMPRVAAWLLRGMLIGGPVLEGAALGGPLPVRLPHVLLASGVTSTVVASPPAPVPAPSPVPSTPARPFYVVRSWAHNRDCLWVIAERYLADPFRWTEIYELNRDRPQPDGRRLGADPLRWVYPGWRLELPADAAGAEVVWLGEGGTQPRGPIHPAPSPPTDRPTVDSTLPATTVPGSVPSMAPPTTVGASTAPTTWTGAPAPSIRSEVDGGAPGARPGDGRPAPRLPIVALAKALLPPVIAGAVLVELGRRALLQHRRRRRGRDVARAARETRVVEWKLRAIPGTEAAEWVDLSLRYLATALAASGVADPPTAVCVRAGALGVEVVVDPPAEEAPPGFEAQERGRLWRLDPAISLDHLRERAGQGIAPAPALLTVGATEEGCVLVNLECAGSLAVEGDPLRVATFLAGAALELAAAPWAREVPLYLVGGDPRLGVGNPRVEVHDDIGAIQARLAGLAREAAGPFDQASTTSGGGPGGEDAGEWLPTAVVVAPGSSSAEAVQELVSMAQPLRGGLAAVVPGPVEGARWRLVIESDGAAVLHPLGLEVTSCLHAETIAGAGALLAARADIEDVAPVVPLAQRDREVTGSAGPAPSVSIRFLRRRPSIDWPGEPPRGSKAVELVHFLAAQEAPVSRARLREALWPMNADDPFDERSLNTFRTAVSRARRALGCDAEGNPVLPKSRDGYYALAPTGWRSDWRGLRTALRRAESASLAESIELLTAALDPVEEGMPLSDLPPTGYGWALAELQDPIIRDLVDAAELLAERALGAGDPDRVEYAARKGLAASPSREALWRARMQAAADTGDRDALKRAYEGVVRAARALDPLGEPESETTLLYRSLQRALARATISTTSTGTGST
jgi:DNA-binding SARP family transcriptional activator